MNTLGQYICVTLQANKKLTRVTSLRIYYSQHKHSKDATVLIRLSDSDFCFIFFSHTHKNLCEIFTVTYV